LNIKNTALYADKISLIHPVSGKKLDFMMLEDYNFEQ
jgi:hypothetical protein